MDYKNVIIAELETLAQKETIEKNTFKMRAYQKVIKQLKGMEKIDSWEEHLNIEEPQRKNDGIKMLKN